MIYLVTASQELFDNEHYKVISPEESLKILEPLRIVGLDTETAGFDVYTKKLLMVQLGCYDFQVVIDCRTIDIKLYKEYLESDRLFLLWNAKFDLRFFLHQRIVIRNVYDGYLAEKLMWLGYPPGYHGLGLKDAGHNYLNVELDKTVRGKIHYAGLSTDVIEYGANDVKYLEKIKEKQLEELKKKELVKAVDCENRFVPVLAYTEYCGVKLDVQKWKEKMAADQKLLDEKEKALNDWVINHYPNDQRFVFVDMQGDLFSGFDTTPKCIINWNSQKQVVPLFELLGFDLMTQDKETGKMKKSIDAKVIEPQKDKSDIAPIYLDYKAAQKVVSTYGDNFLKQLNVDGRIHTNFNQLMDTCRLSCGGKNKQTGEEYVNLQNLPADAETRACFVAEEGNKWISIDYSGQETYLMASISGDEAILDELINGSGDIHSLTAYMSYPEIPRDTPIKDIKKLYHHLRQEAKGIEFAINYGGTGDTIAANKGIPIEEANKIYNNYMKGFKGLKRYQDFRRKDVMDKGYILLNSIFGHKAYIYDYDELMEIKKKFAEEGFWDYYREMKKSAPECDTVQKVKKFFKRKSASEKQSINYPIQNAGAMCFKVSSVYFYNYLLDNNLLFKVKLCIPVHDEWNVEAPENIALDIANKLKECMVKAGSYFCTKCKLDADISWDKCIGEDGKEHNIPGQLPTYWIH